MMVSAMLCLISEPKERRLNQTPGTMRRALPNTDNPAPPLGDTMTVVYFEARLKDKINIFYHHENDPTLKQKKLAPKFVGGRALRWK